MSEPGNAAATGGDASQVAQRKKTKGKKKVSKGVSAAGQQLEPPVSLGRTKEAGGYK